MKAMRLLIAGSPYSGSALLGHVLGAHPHIFFAGRPTAEIAPEEHACPTCGPKRKPCPAWGAHGVKGTSPGTFARAGALATAMHARVVAEGPLDGDELADQLAASRQDDGDVRVIVCTPHPVLYVRKRAGVTPALATRYAAEWRQAHAALRVAAFGSCRPVLVLSYEELASAPGQALRRVCAFLGLEWNEALSNWWLAPSHAVGAGSEMWGVADASNGSRKPVPTDDPREIACETLKVLDSAPTNAIGIESARAVLRELENTDLLVGFGHAVQLPPWSMPSDAAGLQATVAWVREDLARVRSAVLEDRAEEAVGLLRLLVDSFGERFDALGFELTYEALAIVLVDLLTVCGRGADAVTYARSLVAARPESLEGRRLLGVALSTLGDLAGTFSVFGGLVQMSADSGELPPTLAEEVQHLMLCVPPEHPLLSPFALAVAAHVQLADAVEAGLEARREGEAPDPEAVAALAVLRRVRARSRHAESGRPAKHSAGAQAAATTPGPSVREEPATQAA